MSIIENPVLLKNAKLQERINSIENLPTLPETYNQLIIELSSEDSSLVKVSEILSTDVSISAKILQMVNSSFFGLTTKIQNVQQAISYLGVETVKGIVLSAGVFGTIECSDISGFSPAKLYEEGSLIGSKARFIAQSIGLNNHQIDNAMTSGLLHDIGKLVLLLGFADEFKEACTLSKKNDIPLHLAEEQVIGDNDATIGGYLLNSWSLSHSIVQAVALHYSPSNCENPDLDEIAAVHIAYASEHDQKYKKFSLENTAFDVKYTDLLDITDQIPQFIGLTAESIKYHS